MKNPISTQDLLAKIGQVNLQSLFIGLQGLDLHAKKQRNASACKSGPGRRHEQGDYLDDPEHQRPRHAKKKAKAPSGAGSDFVQHKNPLRKRDRLMRKMEREAARLRNLRNTGRLHAA